MKAEDRFVERLREMLPASERVAVGPGDDAAVLQVESGDLVVTTDLVVEGVDFLPETDAEMIGRRALAVNLSDLAAMGARPEFFLLSIGFSAQKGEAFPLAVARGALSRARPLGVSLIGGDLSSCQQTVVSIALWGRAESRPALRSGASAGDLLFVSGFPGRAAAGLCLARGLGGGSGGPAGLAPEQAGELLAAYRDALENKEPLDWILGGGDDYELLFAAPESALAAIGTLASREVPITRIGRLEKGEGAVLRDRGRESDIASVGHDHLERRT